MDSTHPDPGNLLEIRRIWRRRLKAPPPQCRDVVDGLQEEDQAGEPVVVGGCVQLSSAHLLPGEGWKKRGERASLMNTLMKFD